MGKVNFADFKKGNISKKNVEKKNVKVKKTEKIEKVPVTSKKRVGTKLKIEESDLGNKFEPQISWYRGTAELLKGSSVRGTKLIAIRVMIDELHKREKEELKRLENKKVK